MSNKIVHHIVSRCSEKMEIGITTESGRKATVNMEINYTNKTISIKPGDASSKEFGFINQDFKKLDTWEAVILAMSKAVEIAKEEINI